MAVSITKNLVIDQGSQFEVSIRYKDSNNVPVDLTGSAARMSIIKRAGTVVVSPVCTVDNQGYIVCTLTDEQTALIERGTYGYTIDLEDSLGSNTRLFRGNVEVRL